MTINQPVHAVVEGIIDESAKRLPWFILCDLDRKSCAPSFHNDMI